MAGYYEFIVNLRDNFSSGFARLGQGLNTSINQAGAFSFRMNEMNTSLASFGNQFQQVIAPGIEFEKQMKEVQAITGVADKQLKELGKNAMGMAEAFGGNASAGLETYKIILSKLGPELGKSAPALDGMARTITMFAQTMGGDTTAAATALTTAMNSYGVSLKDPIQASRTMAKMADMMTKGIQDGSAEGPQLASALESLGAVASNAGVGFGEAQAALQLLDKYGMKKGAEGGIALRNVLMQMGEGRFMPKQKLEAITKAGVNLKLLGDTSIPLSARLKELAKIQNDGALVGEFFGKENAVAGIAMLKNIGVLDSYAKSFLDSSGATEKYSNTIGSSFAARMARLGAVFSNAGIAIFEATKPYLPMIQAVSTLLFGFSQMYPALVMIGGGLLWVGKQTLFGAVAMARYTGSLIFATVQGLAGFTMALFRASTWQAIMARQTYLNIASMLIVNSVVGITTALMWAESVAVWALNGGLWAMMAPVLAVVAGMAALGVAAYLVYQNWEWLKGYIYGFGQFLYNVGVQMLTTFNPLYWLGRGMLGIMNTFFPSFAGKFYKFWTDLGKWLYDTIKWIWDGIVSFLSSVGKALGLVGDGLDKTMASMQKMGDIKGGDLGKSMGVNELNKGLGNTEEMMKKLGLAMPNTGLPASSPTDIFGSSITSGGGDLPADSKTKRNIDGVNGGGARPTTINISIGKLNEKIEVNTTNLQEGAPEIETKMLQLLMRVLNSANQMDR